MITKILITITTQFDKNITDQGELTNTKTYESDFHTAMQEIITKLVTENEYFESSVLENTNLSSLPENIDSFNKLGKVYINFIELQQSDVIPLNNEVDRK